MRWHDVLEALRVSARADSELTGIYGSAIRLSGAAQHAVPSLVLHLISDNEREVFEPVVIQWSQHCRSMAELIASERRLRALFIHPLAVTISGLPLFTEYLEGVDLEAPTRDNVYARAIRIELQPVKSGLLR